MSVTLEVWGDPIDHSASPALHRAAYEHLALDWRFSRRRVAQDELDANLQAIDGGVRGLALTMPLKHAAFRAADRHDRHAVSTGAVNTLLRKDASWHGFNSDVGGIVDAFREHGVDALDSVRILGAGATSASALVAAAEMGVRRVEVRARRPEQASRQLLMGEALGVEIVVAPFDPAASAVDATVSTLPGGAELPAPVAEQLAASGGVLLDVSYAPWPSAMAAAWGQGLVISGREMLLHQAVRQVRIFVHGDPDAALGDEAMMVTRMREALVGD